MEKELCLKVMASYGFTQAEQGYQHTRNRKDDHTASGSFPSPLFTPEVKGNRNLGIEKALFISWVRATRMSYVPICCR